jgi:predicted choloylglycine hydrolase
MMTKLAKLWLLAAAVGCGVGCRSVAPHSATAATSTAAPHVAEASPLEQLEPIQAANRQLAALAEGDLAAISSWEYCDVTNALPALKASDGVLAATGRLRIAFDKTYGAGRLVKVCPTIAAPGAHLPLHATAKIEGDRATVTAPHWQERKMIRVNNVWRQDLTDLDWSDVVGHFKLDGEPPLPVERLVTNLRAMEAILDRTTKEVEAGKYRSFAEALGVLNSRLHGRAVGGYPAYLAFGLDVTEGKASEPTTQPSGNLPNPTSKAEKGSGEAEGQTTAGPIAAVTAVPVVDLRGDAAELGKSYGEQLGENMRSVLKLYFDKAFNLSTDGGRKLFGLAVKVASGFEQYLRPEHREEIQTLAATVGVEQGQAMLGQCFADLNPDRACSTISFPAAAAPDGIARFGRNLDYVTFGVLNTNSVLLIYHPKARYAFASVSPAPGLIGVLSGMNEHGLCLAVMEVPRTFRLPHAMPCMLLYRTVLENCRTVDEAIEFLRTTPRQSANNLMLMDPSGERVVAELTPDKVTVRHAKDEAALISTNHQRGNDFDSPGQCLRFDYLHDSSLREFGQITESTLEGMLAGCAQGEFTFQSMIFEPANRVLYLAVGAGAPGHRFERVDLKRYFQASVAAH